MIMYWNGEVQGILKLHILGSAIWCHVEMKKNKKIRAPYQHLYINNASFTDTTCIYKEALNKCSASCRNGGEKKGVWENCWEIWYHHRLSAFQPSQMNLKSPEYPTRNTQVSIHYLSLRGYKYGHPTYRSFVWENDVNLTIHWFLNQRNYGLLLLGAKI